MQDYRNNYRINNRNFTQKLDIKKILFIKKINHAQAERASKDASTKLINFNCLLSILTFLKI